MLGRDFSHDLVLAHQLADAADAVSRQHFCGVSSLRFKADGSPVTAADFAIEDRIRQVLKAERPGDLILGEEFSELGDTVPAEAAVWVIDPIDQTRHFARGDPNYATLICLVSEGLARVAVASAPGLRTRWHAIRGGGAYSNGKRIGVSSVPDLGEAHLGIAGHREWFREYDWPAVASLMDRVSYVQGTAGGFLPAMHVAAGLLDAAVEPWGSVWEHFALGLIVEQAGGRSSTLSGGPCSEGSLLVSNGVLHDRLLGFFKAVPGQEES